MDPAISAQVGLTTLQAKKVKQICQEFAKRDEDVSAMIANAVADVPEPKAGEDRAAYEKKRLKVAEAYTGERQRIDREKIAAEKQVAGLMTPAQKAKWLDLSGPVPKR